MQHAVKRDKFSYSQFIPKSAFEANGDTFGDEDKVLTFHNEWISNIPNYCGSMLSLHLHFEHHFKQPLSFSTDLELS